MFTGLTLTKMRNGKGQIIPRYYGMNPDGEHAKIHISKNKANHIS